MTIYRFTVWYDMDDFVNGTLQERFVMADSEDEARSKLESYNKKMVEEGSKRMIIGRCIVYIEEVLV